jgi:amidophosphoribosyltransferase
VEKKGAVNHVRRLYEPFTPEEISAKIVEARPAPEDRMARRDRDHLPDHREPARRGAEPHRRLVFHGPSIPTPGGYRVVNQAYVNYYEKNEGRSY